MGRVVTSSGTGDTPTAPNAADVIAAGEIIIGTPEGGIHRRLGKGMAGLILEALEAACPGSGPLCIVDGRLVRAEPIAAVTAKDRVHLNGPMTVWRISGTGP